MINVLFVGKNLKYLFNLINKLIVLNKELRVYGIATTDKEIKELTLDRQIDIIIMDLQISKVNYLIEHKIIDSRKFKKSIILIIENVCEVDKLYDTKYIYDYVEKSTNLVETISNINCLLLSQVGLENINKTKEQELEIRVKINNELRELGYNFELLGTKYLAETIYILYTLKDYFDDNLERDIYPIVAKKYSKPPHTIKCNIRNATDIMYYDNEEEKIRKYLGNSYNIKPGTKIIVSTILNKMQLFYEIVSLNK